MQDILNLISSLSKSIFHVTISILFSFLLVNNTLGQNLRFKNYSIDDGLSQNNIYCIIQDNKGFIWIGTNKGLNKYDGYTFKKFGGSRTNSSVLSENVIECIKEDSNGNIWIGTGSSGVYYYNNVIDDFEQIKFDSIPSNIVGRDRVISIIEGEKNNIWFTAGNSINKLDVNSKIITNYIPSHIIKKNPSQIEITIIFEDSRGNFWFGTKSDGLGLFNRNDTTFSYFSNDNYNLNSISDNSITSIFESKDGTLWVGTYNGGFNRFIYDSKQFRRYYPNKYNKESFTIKTFCEDKQGNLWLGTRNGLYVLDISKNLYEHYYSDDSDPNSLSNNNIKTIIKDSKGNFWIGSKGGINFFNTDNLAFIHYRTSSFNNHSLNKHRVNDIVESSDGSIIFGTSEGGLNLLNPQTGIFKYYMHIPGNNSSLSSNNVKVIREDRNHDIWIGTFQGGLNKFDKKTGKFKHFKNNPELELIHQKEINSILIDKKDRVWICTYEGIKLFDKQNKSFVFTGLKQNSEAVFGIEDYNGDFWIAFRNRKLYRFNPITLASQSFNLPIYSSTSIVKTIIVDENLLWFGTSNSGLIQFDKLSGEFKVYKQTEGLPDNGVLGILKNNTDELWLSTREGLSKFNPSKEKFTNFYKENGIQNNQFTGAALKTKAGKIYFGDFDGAISFNPDDIHENRAVSPVVFTDFSILNKPVQIGGDNPILTSHISEAKKISLDYSHTSFTFTYSTLDYALSEKIQYAYKMKGFENNWNFVNNRRYAAYTNLSYGKYHFKVKAANINGEWNEPTVIEINIAPPYWHTWWFRVIVLCILGLIIGHTIKYFTQKRNLLKATALANKTQLKLLRNQMNPHFLLNAFSAIRALVLINKNQAWEMISKFSEYFRYVLLNYKREKDTLNDEIDAVKNYLDIQKVCFHENLKVEVKIDEKAKDLIVPSFILQPIVENALKYGSETDKEYFELGISAEYNNNQLIVDISNTGTLNLVKSVKDNEINVHGTSINNLKQRMQLMFGNDYNFNLFERNGIVHAELKINYGENGHKNSLLKENV